MNAVRIHRRIESETLHLPELKPFLGKAVEIIVLEETPPEVTPPQTRGAFFRKAAQQPRLDPEELASMRADPKFERFWPILDVAGKDIFDVDAILSVRTEELI